MSFLWFDRHIRRPGTFETFHFLFPVHHECAEGCFGLQSKDGNDCMGKAILLLIGIGTIIWLLCLPIHETTLLNFVFEGVITLVFTVAVLWMVFCKDENFVVVRDMAISKVKTFLYNRC